MESPLQLNIPRQEVTYQESPRDDDSKGDSNNYTYSFVSGGQSGYQISEEGVNLVMGENEVRQRDLDGVKETIEAKLETINVKIAGLDNQLDNFKSDIKEDLVDIKALIQEVSSKLDGKPSTQDVEGMIASAKLNGLIWIIGTIIAIGGLLIAYLEWRVV